MPSKDTNIAIALKDFPLVACNATALIGTTTKVATHRFHLNTSHPKRGIRSFHYKITTPTKVIQEKSSISPSSQLKVGVTTLARMIRR